MSRGLDVYAPASALSERYYIIELKCAAKDEAIVRAMLLQALAAHKLRLQSMESHAGKAPCQVEADAVIHTRGDQDAAVEHLVGQLGLLANVYSTSWAVTAARE